MILQQSYMHHTFSMVVKFSFKMLANTDNKTAMHTLIYKCISETSGVEPKGNRYFDVFTDLYNNTTGVSAEALAKTTTVTERLRATYRALATLASFVVATSP